MKKLLLLFLILSLPLLAKEEKVRPLLEKYCYNCHGFKKQKGDINLQKDLSPADVLANFETWQECIEQLKSGEMPPKKSPQPSPEETRLISNWIYNIFQQAKTRPDPGKNPLRRLNRFEYNNVIRDLTGHDLQLQLLFPEEGSAGEGFNNNAEVLRLSPLIFEKFLLAAQKVSSHLHFTLHDGFTFLKLPQKPQSDLQLLLSLKSQLESIKIAQFPEGFQIEDQLQPYLDAMWKWKFQLADLNDKQLASRLKLNPVFLRKWRQYTDQNSEVQKNTVEIQALKKWHQLNASSHWTQRKDAYLAFSQAYSQAREKMRTLRKEEAQIYKIMFNRIRGKIFKMSREEYLEVMSAQEKTLYTKLEQQISLLQNHTQQNTSKNNTSTRLMLSQLKPHLKNLLLYIWRRPATPQELKREELFFLNQWQQSESLQLAASRLLTRLLSSPRFLFRVEQPATSDTVSLVEHFDFATRLSFFLWSSAPDKELLQLAAEKKLQQPQIIKQQIQRMLADPRSRSLADNFASQWLLFGEILENASLDKKHFPAFNKHMQRLLYEECAGFFHHILIHNKPLHELFSSEMSWLNEELASHYNIPGILGKNFRLVNTAKYNRGGLLSSGAICAITSYPLRTSPVLRGNWILSQVLGTPTPPPPANVEPLPENNSSSDKVSIRQRLEQHRQNPACINCHKRIDPLGFPMEALDPLGRWRTHADDHPVDTLGELPSGEKIPDLKNLKLYLTSKKNELAQNVTRRMLGYSLGRSLEFYDMATLENIQKQFESNNLRIHSLIQAIVFSTAFRYRRPQKKSE